MAIEQIAPFSKCERRRYEFIIDDDSDVTSLPETCAAGSTALSCATGNKFIVNASHRWVLLGGGSTGSDESEEPFMKLATPVICLEEETIPAILGVAVLGKTILGDYGNDLPQLGKPEIYMEVIAETVPQLETPEIYLTEV